MQIAAMSASVPADARQVRTGKAGHQPSVGAEEEVMA
jgi:hypothetical protein